LNQIPSTCHYKLSRLCHLCEVNISNLINLPSFSIVESIYRSHTNQGLTNPLARRPGLVISTFGLAEIISCMPDRLVKIYIGYWQTCQYSRIYLYSYICYMLFNQQQCFIYSTASFLSKLRAKKVEKLHILVIKQLQQMMAYRKFRKWNTAIGFRNRERLFPVLPIIKKIIK
jgi:hypothetical protein